MYRYKYIVLRGAKIAVPYKSRPLTSKVPEAHPTSAADAQILTPLKLSKRKKKKLLITTRRGNYIYIRYIGIYNYIMYIIM